MGDREFEKKFLKEKKVNGLRLRKLKLADCIPISMAFKAQGWDKPVLQYEHYFRWQEEGIRDIILAEVSGEFAGYLTILWESNYTLFKERSIPEIVDFNVLKKFQRQGIGTALMDEAEKRISLVSDFSGIGFGMVEDYGAAQILYIKRGYIPDGKGLYYDDRQLVYKDEVTVDDSLVFHLIKELQST